jgi:hypothetical protein
MGLKTEIEIEIEIEVKENQGYIIYAEQLSCLPVYLFRRTRAPRAVVGHRDPLRLKCSYFSLHCIVACVA